MKILPTDVDKALPGEQAGVIFMREGHQVQFPADIQLFYIAPPSLEDLKRFPARGRQKRKKPPKKRLMRKSS